MNDPRMQHGSKLHMEIDRERLLRLVQRYEAMDGVTREEAMQRAMAEVETGAMQRSVRVDPRRQSPK